VAYAPLGALQAKKKKNNNHIQFSDLVAGFSYDLYFFRDFSTIPAYLWIGFFILSDFCASASSRIAHVVVIAVQCW